MMKENSLRNVIYSYAIPFFSVIFVLFLLYQAYTLFIGRARFAVFFVLFALVVSALNFIADPVNSLFKIIKGKRLIIAGFLLIALSMVTTLYLAINFNALSWRAGANTTIDYTFALVLLIPVLLMAWKRGGDVLILLVLFALVYMTFGPAFPGFLKHGGFGIRELLTVQVLSLADSGLLCAATQVVATWVAIFIVYAGIIQGFGAFDAILKGSFVVCRKKLDLVPQVPIVASLLFGSISGAASANVGATGSFTIPLMKRYGLHPRLAGAIEAVASSGGQVMPPVMGATAFLMAMLLGVSYLDVMLCGFIPALLFYWVFAYGVYDATKGSIQSPISDLGKGKVSVEEEEYGFTRKDIVKLIPMCISVAVILIILMYFRMDVLQAALYGIIAFLTAQLLFELFSSRKIGVFLEFGRKFVRGATIGAGTAANVGAIVAGMALILKALTATALAPKISYMIVDIAGGSLVILLILIWAICLLFGMAVSTLIVYLLVVVLTAPAMEGLGIVPMVSHFIIFYFAAISMITPPTAPASLVASGIAGESFMKTAFQAMRVGMPLFILPFTFVTYPELILFNSRTLLAVFLVVVGFMGISHCLNSRKTHWQGILVRAISLAGGGFISFHAFFYPEGRIIAVFVAVCILLLLGRNVIIQKLKMANGITHDRVR